MNAYTPNEEKETIINFNEASAAAEVYTFNVALKNKLARLAADEAQPVKFVKDYGDGAVVYEVDKSMVSIRPKRVLTEEQKKAMVNNLKKVSS